MSWGLGYRRDVKFGKDVPSCPFTRNLGIILQFPQSQPHYTVSSPMLVTCFDEFEKRFVLPTGFNGASCTYTLSSSHATCGSYHEVVDTGIRQFHGVYQHYPLSGQLAQEARILFAAASGSCRTSSNAALKTLLRTEACAALLIATSRAPKFP